MSRVRRHGAELAVGHRSEIALPRGSRTAPGRARINPEERLHTRHVIASLLRVLLPQWLVLSMVS